MGETTTFVKYAPKKAKRSEVPLTTKWKNAPMIRIHSLRAAVREVLNLSDSMDVVKINIVGTPSSGKTSIAEAIMHLCHDMSKIPFVVRKFSKNDLLNFEHTLSKLQPTNHILLFDDISFLSAVAGKKQIEKIQQAFTEIRHLPGGQDVKIITIFNFHYNMAVSKYLRQSDFFVYTNIGSSELENTQKIMGNKNTNKILEFRRVVQEALTIKKFSFKLSHKNHQESKGRFTYPFRAPFAPVLWWNNDTARIVVYPLRKWIQPLCGACSNAAIKSEKDKMDIDKFNASCISKFGIGIIRHALKIKLFTMGVNTYPKRVKQCMAYVEEYMSKNETNAEDLAEFYNLRDNKTRLDFKVEESETKA